MAPPTFVKREIAFSAANERSSACFDTFPFSRCLFRKTKGRPPRLKPRRAPGNRLYLLRPSGHVPADHLPKDKCPLYTSYHSPGFGTKARTDGSNFAAAGANFRMEIACVRGGKASSKWSAITALGRKRSRNARI